MIHIGIDARFAGVAQGGIGRYVEEAVKALAGVNEDFVITLFVRRENGDLFALDGRFRKVIAGAPWYGWREQTEMPALFRRAGCDIYHIPHFNVPLTMPRPFVMTLHDLIMWEEGRARDTTRGWLGAQIKNRGMRSLVRHALKRSAVCVVPSQWVAERIASVTGASPHLVEVVYEGAETLKGVNPLAWEDAVSRFPLCKPYILTVGNVYTHKNISLAIDAVAQLKNRFPDLYHIHAGPKHPKKFFEDTVQYGKKMLGTNFSHVGHVSDAELAALYQNAIAYIAPSRAEGFALPALEAMGMGTPVIAARAHCFSEILGDAAYYAEGDNRDALADAIAHVLTDASLRADFSKRGTIRASQFTWKQHALRLFFLYKKVLRKKGKR